MKKEAKNKTPRQSLGRVLKNNLRMVIKVARLTPEYFFTMILEGIVWGLINSAYSVFTVRLFDALDKGTPFSECAAIVLYMAAFYLFAYAVDAWYWQYYNPLVKQKLHLKLHSELFKKAHTLDVACYDDPAFYNDFVWAMDESATRSAEIIGDIGKLINRIVAGTTLFTLIFTIDYKVSVVLILNAMLAVVINHIGNKVSYEAEKEQKPMWRKRNYINRVYHLADHAKELRISHAHDLMMDEMDKNTEDMVRTSRKYGKKYFLLYGLFNSVLGNIIYFGVMLYMFTRLIDGAVLVGAFTASVGMIWRVRWLLSDFVERITKFPKHSLFLEKYYGFLNYKPRTVSGEAEASQFESLELKNVSFMYDFSANPRYQYHEADHKVEKNESEGKYALKNVSLKLNKGEKIAIVGYNGAGKTTLIKLLLRLYDPTEGEVLFNGVNAKEYKLDEYRAKIGTVFQDFKIFAASIGENVMNGNYTENDRETVEAALKASGFGEKLSTLEDGIDTHLTREFNDKGTNLSGGEAQKVAIARVFARPYELIIMDEPSSALDPIAEYELNRAIAEYAEDKTVIFISHRLSTTRMADRIYMFANGTLEEFGSHDELMEKGGKYAEMFELQSEKYRC
ncbi:MAG: ABC transporter ATP-binding protein [Clostridia bacterium]|nr:ABC transporter ATP-binding protein [Clostridia bacterium]